MYELNANQWQLRGSPLGGGAQQAWFGWSVDLSGDGTILAAGAIGANGKTGTIQVYHFSGDGAWTPIAQTLNGDVAQDNAGASVSLSEDGNFLAWGAPFNSEADPRAGQAKVFRGVLEGAV